MVLLYVLMAGATLLAAAYVQLQLPAYVAVHSHAVIARICLVAVGLAVGLLSASTQPGTVYKALAFASGFGIV